MRKLWTDSAEIGWIVILVILISMGRKALCGELVELILRLMYYLVDLLYAVGLFGVLEGQSDAWFDLGNISIIYSYWGGIFQGQHNVPETLWNIPTDVFISQILNPFLTASKGPTDLKYIEL